MEAVEKQPDQLNMFALVVITLVSAFVVYGSFVGLQAYFEHSLASLEEERREARLMDDELPVDGVDFSVSDLDAEHAQALSSYVWVNQEQSVVTLPIDVAMAKVVEAAKGAPTATLVPTVGASDTPTVPAVAGRPPDNVQMPAPTAPATEGDGEGADTGEGAAEGDAAGTDAAGTDAAGTDAAGAEGGAAGDADGTPAGAGTEPAAPASNPAPAAANPAPAAAPTNPAPSAPATDTAGENAPQ